VVRYFEDIDEFGEDFLYEAKLLIVGEPGAGKTSLYRKLVNENAELPKKDETTRGIDIHEYHFKTAQKKDFRINLWDFGGQVIMYFAHQFFLTANSLYILVTDGRQENSNFKYWLHVIDLLGKDSKIIVVQNEVGNRVHRTNLNDYVSRFKNIVFTKSLNLDKNLPRIRSLRKKVEEEINLAHTLNIIFKAGSQVTEVMAKENQITGLKGKEIEWIEPNKFIPANAKQINGTDFSLNVDLVVQAIGTKPGEEIKKFAFGLKTDEKGIIAVKNNYETNIPGVFAGGDVVNGGATVVQAVGDGKKAAESIDSYLC